MDIYSLLYTQYPEYEKFMDEQLAENPDPTPLSMNTLITEVQFYGDIISLHKLVNELINELKTINIDYNVVLNINRLMFIEQTKKHIDGETFAKYSDEIHAKFFPSKKNFITAVNIDIKNIQAICAKILELFVRKTTDYIIEFSGHESNKSNLVMYIKYFNYMSGGYFEFPIIVRDIYEYDDGLVIETDIPMGENPILKSINADKEEQLIKNKKKIQILAAHTALIGMLKDELMNTAVELNFTLHSDNPDLKEFIASHDIDNEHYFTMMNGKINQQIATTKACFASQSSIHGFVSNDIIEPLFNLEDLEPLFNLEDLEFFRSTLLGYFNK